MDETVRSDVDMEMDERSPRESVKAGISQLLSILKVFGINAVWVVAFELKLIT